MLVYLITFIFSAFFMFIYEKKSMANKKSRYIFLILAIALPSILGGIRAVGVGTDTKVYIEKNFILAQNYSKLSVYLKNFSASQLYWIITFIVSRFTNNINWLFFVIQLIIMILAYMVSYNNKKRTPMWLTYLTFLFLFYNRSLNMSRNTISLMIIVYSLKFVESKKPIKFIFSILIAFLFHETALIGLILYPLYIFVSNDEKKIKKVTITLVCIITVCMYQPLMNLLINQQIISQKYDIYVSGAAGIKEYEWILKFIGVIMLQTTSRITIKNDKFNAYLVFMALLDFITYNVAIFSHYAYRISFYFGYTTIITYPQIRKAFVKGRSRKIMNIGYILFLITYWWFYYIFKNNDQTYPYIFG